MSQIIRTPVFLMSIDTEMLWGPTTSFERALLSGKAKEDRDAIATLLKMLDNHHIAATWAIVGHLFEDFCEESQCLTSKNKNVYGYRPDWYRDPYSNRNLDPLYYGKDIVEKILTDGVNQEVGYHSYSHPIFTDIPREMAEEEIAQAKGIEKSWGIKLKSFVFPQNKIAHVDLLPKYGFSIFRGKSAQKRKEDMNLIHRKMNGAIEKIIAHPVEPKERSGIWEIPGSMSFSDAQIPSSVQFRARLGLRNAINNGQVFHIFIHPWNLLLYDRLKNDLDKFLGYVDSKRDAGEIMVLTMGEYAARLSEAKGF